MPTPRSNAVRPPRLRSDDRRKTFVWWALLCVIACFNIKAWLLDVGGAEGGDSPAAGRPPQLRSTYQHHQWVLSGIYTLVCAYRSVLPRVDLERRVLFDTPLSSIAAGRTAATVAEMAFALQWALALQHVGGMLDRAAHPVLLTGIDAVAVIAPLCIAIAQGCCWWGVLAKNHLAHAVEESIWMVTFGLIGVVCAAIAVVAGADGAGSTLVGDKQQQHNTAGLSDVAYVAGAAAGGCASFVAFMAAVDVPMYLRRWRQQRRRDWDEPPATAASTTTPVAAGSSSSNQRKTPSSPASFSFSLSRSLSLTLSASGWVTALHDCVATRRATAQWRGAWREEAPWMTGYFTLCVWVSQAMITIV